MNNRLQLAEGMIAQMRTKMTMQDEKILDLTARSMRDNVVIQGIPENKKESWDDTKQLVTNFLKNKMKIRNTDDILIDRAHRMGAKQQGVNAKPRPVVAKLMTQKSKDIIFQKLKSLDPESGFGIQEQLPPEVTERRKRLWSKYKDAKKDPNNTVRWNLDKLVINGVSFSALDTHHEIDPKLAAATETSISHTPHDTVDGSTFMGHSAKIENKQEVPIVMAKLLEDRSLATATHNIYAYRIVKEDGKFDEGFCDDGEHSAGFKVLQYMRTNHIQDAILIVTRWFGNKMMASAASAAILLDSL
jgi:hypothetical protein